MIILKADRTLFGWIIVMAQGRSLKIEDILSHPLGPLPWALSTSDGLLRKTNKASLATHLQKGMAVAEEHLENCTVKKEVNIAHQIRCADEVSIRTPFLECTAHQIWCAQHTKTCVDSTLF